MSLISIRNFVAPLQNRLHLGTIIVVGVLIGVARLSGAAISVRDDHRGALDRVPVSTGASTDDDTAGLPRNDQGNLPAHKSADKANGDELLNGLFQEDNAAAKKKDPPANNHGNRPAGQLQDIRRSLGLE